jgi:hypothetical protein
MRATVRDAAKAATVAILENVVLPWTPSEEYEVAEYLMAVISAAIEEAVRRDREQTLGASPN